MSYTYLVPPVPGQCIADPGELEQLVSQAALGVNIGMTYQSDTAPDVVTYPEQKKFIWIDTSGAKPVERHWNENTLSWEQDLPATGSITGDMIADYTIPLIKLDPTGGTPDYVLRLNPAGTQVIYDDTQNLFTNTNRLSVGVLSLSAVGAYVLYSDGVTNSWETFASLFATGALALTQIDTTGAISPQVLAYYSGALGYQYVETVMRDGMTPIKKLAVGAAYYILRMKSDGSEPEWVAPSSIINSVDTGLLSLPTVVNTPVTYAHNLASTALQVTIYGVCVVANNGYNPGDVVSLSAFTCDDNAGTITVSGSPALIYTITTTQIKLWLMAHAGTFFKVADVTTGVNAGAATTSTDWNWRAIITKI